MDEWKAETCYRWCPSCREMFQVHHTKHSPSRRYCSAHCARERRDKTRHDLECLFCGNLIEATDKRKKYCNSRCATAYRRYRGTQEGVFGYCANLNCGNLLDKKNKKYCSAACRQRAYRNRNQSS